MEDPFYAVRDDIDSSLASANALHSRLSSLLLSPSNPSSKAELSRTAAQLGQTLTVIEEDLVELREAVKASEADPKRFRLDLREVSSRKQWVERAGTRVREMRQLVVAAGTGGAAGAAGAGAGAAKRDGVAVGLSNPPLPTAQEMKMTQQHLMRTQDAQLEGVLSTVNTLKHVAVAMGEEVDDQRRLLEDLDTQVDTTGGKLAVAMRRAKKVLEETKNDKGMMTIVCLGVVFLILLVLVIVT
ncbi:hypothetical protein M427DRAFT_110467 [Gonapodya prolifera JEL478]|uniref:t-SNARE affecting a late Golgi compartment protein 1 n=1 Tax=Gonapodya prolifera (strain JEL478) TaxID=1344416 RepID=A0A139ALC4_GONPJ|nr:hypothetical protein M427DRAFT_110467 [Gonapodya prolifera JEL478]|eukprot:KXS17344.1 hypothetical protein M427DRAFT_110467 [Gonapodya prolifera JEL478]